MDDFLSSDDPNVWGPPLWDLMFTLAFRLPHKDVAIVIDLFAQLEKVLPCQSCRRSYAVFRKQLSPLTSLRMDNTKAALWLWTIHDMVNQKLDKSAISYDALKTKHKYITSLAHPMSALDILHIMLLHVKPEYVADFGNTLIRATKVCNGMKPFASVFRDKTLTKDNVHNSLREARDALHDMYDISRDA